MRGWRVGRRGAAEKRDRRRLWWGLGIGVLVLALVSGGITWWAWRHLDSQIETADDFDKILVERPALPDGFEVGDGLGKGPLNILILGTDTREGQKVVKSSTPGLSDTTILLHVSKDRERAAAISIPRDLMVDRPQCRDREDETEIHPARSQQMWNAAFALGGPACTIAQFEQMTGVRVTNFLVTRFESVKSVADALDGVPICMPYEIDDPKNQIYLPKGSYDAKGDVAVSYVRVRYKIGNGGDLGRLKRQQVFLASMLDKASALGTLANPVRFYDFLDAATRSIVTDPVLGDLGNLIGLQRDVKRIGMHRVAFLTMPVAPYAPDPNRLAPGEDADLLWSDVRTDRRLHWRFLEDATTGSLKGPDEADDDSAGPLEAAGLELAAATVRTEDKGISREEAEEFGLCATS